MKNDPFALLGVGTDASNADLNMALGQATRRGVSRLDARHAYDNLRNSESREAMGLLAISLTPAFQSLMADAGGDDAGVEASSLVAGAVSAVLADLEVHLAGEEVMPHETVARDVRDYVPPPMEELEP